MKIIGAQQGFGGVVLVAIFQIEQPHDSGQFFVIEFDDGGEFHRIGDYLRVKEMLAQVDVADAHCIWFCGEKKAAHGTAAAFRALRQGTEAYSIGLVR